MMPERYTADTFEMSGHNAIQTVSLVVEDR